MKRDLPNTTPRAPLITCGWFAAGSLLALASFFALRATGAAQAAVDAQSQARLATVDDLRLVGPAGRPVVLHDALGNAALKRRYHFLIVISSAVVLATMWCAYRGGKAVGRVRGPLVDSTGSSSRTGEREQAEG